MNIVRGTVQEWDTLEKIKTVFEKKGFEDIESEDGGLIVTILDDENLGKEFLKIILVKDDFGRYYTYLKGTGGTAVTYLLLVKDFEEFVFVRESITILGKNKIEKFKFYRNDPKRSSLEKLNGLNLMLWNRLKICLILKQLLTSFTMSTRKREQNW